MSIVSRVKKALTKRSVVDANALYMYGYNEGYYDAVGFLAERLCMIIDNVTVEEAEALIRLASQEGPIREKHSRFEKVPTIPISKHVKKFVNED